MSRRAASATHRIVIGVHGSKNANAAWDWAAAQSQAALAFFDPWTPITIRCVALAALLLILGVTATVPTPPRVSLLLHMQGDRPSPPFFHGRSSGMIDLISRRVHDGAPCTFE